MCGVTGLWTTSQGAEPLQAALYKMTTSLSHRGPDDEGYWIDAKAGIALGHRRLSILDLSPEGHQPMVSPSARYRIVFNGEIYNYEDIRKQLHGVTWRGHSDTEVMLAAFDKWGVEAAVQHFVGMFAFALWDSQERCLYLVRDRLGIKPLYYGWNGGTFLFASELKAFRAHPAFDAEVDRDALALLIRHNYITHPYSIYRGIRKLSPGTILRVTDPASHEVAPVAYWSARQVAERGQGHKFDGGDEDAIAAAERLLKDAVALRMIADVPLGAFLSGGIDSSLVVALMQAQSSQPVKTFTIGFREQDHDEAKYARDVAQHLGTDHTELYVSPEEAMAVVPRLPELYDEPFADSSQIPTFLVSQLARRRVIVSLSGDGGDELFSGYTRYLVGAQTWGRIFRVPKFARAAGGKALQAGLRLWSDDRLGRAVQAFPAMRNRAASIRRGQKLALALQASSFDQVYLGIMSQWTDPEDVVLGSKEPPTPLSDCSQWPNLHDTVSAMMYLDLVTYLPEDILTKVDRASMGVSLEARVPLLDHRVVEFAWTLPSHMRTRGGAQKWLLKQLLYKYVPRSLVERPKMGFAIPLGSWLRGPLRDWVESLIDESVLRNGGFLRSAPVRNLWRQHLAGRANWEYQLWNVITFQAWLQASRQPGHSSASALVTR